MFISHHKKNKIFFLIGASLLLAACATRQDAAPVISLLQEGNNNGVAYPTDKGIVTSQPKVNQPSEVKILPLAPTTKIENSSSKLVENTANFTPDQLCRNHQPYVIPRIGKTANYLEMTPGSYPNAKYTVVAGDTLTMLSFISGLDIEQIKKLNNINDNNIRIGQVIIFHDCGIKNTAQVNQTADNKTLSPAKVNASVENKSTQLTQSSNNTISSSTTSEEISGRDESTINTNVVPPQTVVIGTPKENKRQNNISKVVSGWSWPANGPIVSRFSNSNSGTRGIDIAGRLNDPIYAVSAGIVAYAGNELQGYGNLIIIKHDNGYISAYSHNNVMLVKKGDRVASGQQISKMGSTGTNRIILHFELRKDKVAIDPLTILPKR